MAKPFAPADLLSKIQGVPAAAGNAVRMPKKRVASSGDGIRLDAVESAQFTQGSAVHEGVIVRARNDTTMTDGHSEHDGIWIIDDEGRTSYVNDRMAEILGAHRSEIIGHSSFDYIFPEDLGAARLLFAAKKDGHIRPFGFKLRRKDGAPVFVEVQGTPMFNAAGAFKGVVGTFTVSQ